MILGRGPRLHIKLGHATLRQITMNATAGSLDEAERALILQAVERCNFAHSCIEWGCHPS